MESADSLFKEAQTFEKKWSILSSQDNKERAIMLYKKAAAMYKINKQIKQAAETYEMAGKLAERIKDVDMAHECYNFAGGCYRSILPNEAIRCYKQCINLNTGSNLQIAGHYKAIAEIQELYDQNAAYQSYEMTEKHYRLHDYESRANEILIKLANIDVNNKRYSKAQKLYDNVASIAINNDMLTYSAVSHITKAILCAIAVARNLDADNKKNGDLNEIITQINDYKNKISKFSGSKESSLLEKCVGALLDDDMKTFEEVVDNYDKIYKLDKICTSILLEIKNSYIDKEDCDLIGANVKDNGDNEIDIR
jgi:tetratricopeptide (TPR) repeat protein